MRPLHGRVRCLEATRHARGEASQNRHSTFIACALQSLGITCCPPLDECRDGRVRAGFVVRRPAGAAGSQGRRECADVCGALVRGAVSE